METLGNNSCKKNANNYYCEICHFFTSNKNNFNIHNSTRKHKKKEIISKMEIKSCTKTKHCDGVKPPHIFECFYCNKIYKTNSGLWKHSKMCDPLNTFNNSNSNSSTSNNTSINNNDSNYPDLIMTLINQNKDLQQQLVDISKEKSTIINNTTTNNTMNNNTMNNKFNLQFFLNEKCKDALNIMDFVDSLQITLSDLENVGSKGFVDGISKILLKGLKELDVCKRPIHCSDLKRETMYIKNENSWEKENEEKQNMKRVIKQIADKNIKVIPEWKSANPECRDGDSKKNDQYMNIINESMGSVAHDGSEDNYSKIIRKVANETVIQKQLT